MANYRDNNDTNPNNNKFKAVAVEVIKIVNS